MEKAENYLTLKQAAEESGLTYASLRREVEKGRLPAFRAGRKYFISRQELRQYQQETPAEGYTIRQLMEILPLSYAFIIELIHDGRLLARKCGRRYIVTEESLEQFLAESRQE